MGRKEKFQKLYNDIKALGIPVSYFAFKEPVNPPFIVYYSPHVTNFVADNTIYMQQDYIEVELYTNKKDFELEEKVRQMLIENGYIFEQYETYIQDEKMFLITFGFSI